MARKRWADAWLRYPKTQQERRANQDRHDPYVRGKRRHLPTAYDDQFVHKEKNWKYLRRDHQYREQDSGYEWHEFNYSWRDVQERMIARNIMRYMDSIGCFYDHTRTGIRWYGPEYWVKGRCPHCYTQLVSDTLSELLGDWCPNEDCPHPGI